MPSHSTLKPPLVLAHLKGKPIATTCSSRHYLFASIYLAAQVAMLLLAVLEPAMAFEISPTTEKATCLASSISHSSCFFSLAPGSSPYLVATAYPVIDPNTMGGILYHPLLANSFVFDYNRKGGNSSVLPTQGHLDHHPLSNVFLKLSFSEVRMLLY